jgi:alpha-tubulin suppressor-like RCC1 family protein
VPRQRRARVRRVRPLAAACLLTSALAGCEDAAAPAAYHLERLAGDGQTGEIRGQALQPLAVRVVDEEGGPVRGVPVVWRVLEGGAGVPVSVVTTDSLGVATTSVTFGVEPGPVLILAEAAGSEVRFRLAAERRWRSAAAGLRHSCALSTIGEVYCWGANEVAQLGDDTEKTRAIPAALFGRLEFSTLAVGWLHTCAIDVESALWCWGSNDLGQVGVGDRNVRHRPTRVHLDEEAIAVGAGYLHTCAVVKSGSAYCWGSNAERALGIGEVSAACAGIQCALTPTRVASDVRFRTVSAGEFHTCALTADGAAYCWGLNSVGEVGVGEVPGKTYPTPVRVASEHPFAVVSTHARHSCAVTTTGQGWCWGRSALGESGELGNWWSPAPLPGALTMRGISTGNLYTCATLVDQRTACFGDQRGREKSVAPQLRSTPPFAEIAVGFAHTCGVAGGRVWCWGSNTSGQLGPRAVGGHVDEPVDVPLPL